MDVIKLKYVRGVGHTLLFTTLFKPTVKIPLDT